MKSPRFMSVSDMRHGLSMQLTLTSWFEDEGAETLATPHSQPAEMETAADVDATRLSPEPACKQWKFIVAVLAALMIKDRSQWSEYEQEIAKSWNTRVASRYPRTSVAILAELHEMYPQTRPRDFAEDGLQLGRISTHARHF